MVCIKIAHKVKILRTDENWLWNVVWRLVFLCLGNLLLLLHFWSDLLDLLRILILRHIFLHLLSLYLTLSFHNFSLLFERVYDEFGC